MNGFKHLGKFAILAVVLGATSCVSLNAPLSGVVIDKSTGKPVEGAIVVAHWQGDGFNPVDSRTVCFHVESTATNKKGEYRISSFPRIPFGVFNTYAYVAGVYKEGYREVEYKDTLEPGFQKAPSGIEYLIPFAGDREERFQYLYRLHMACSGAGESNRTLVTAYTAVYEELKRLSVTDEDKKKLSSYRRHVARIAVSSDKRNRTGREEEVAIDNYLRDHPL